MFWHKKRVEKTLVVVPEHWHQPYDDDAREEACNVNSTKSLP